MRRVGKSLNKYINFLLRQAKSVYETWGLIIKNVIAFVQKSSEIEHFPVNFWKLFFFGFFKAYEDWRKSFEQEQKSKRITFHVSKIDFSHFNVVRYFFFGLKGRKATNLNKVES